MKNMRITLNNSVLDALVAEGFKYALSKTYEINNPAYTYSVVLTPLKDEPDFTNYQKSYDACFSIHQEGNKMVKGINGARIFVDLNDHDLVAIKTQLLRIK
jgi:hypothetical protein